MDRWFGLADGMETFELRQFPNKQFVIVGKKRRKQIKNLIGLIISIYKYRVSRYKLYRPAVVLFEQVHQFMVPGFFRVIKLESYDKCVHS